MAHATATSEPADPPLPSGPGREALGRSLCRAMAAIHRRGWCDGTGGNFSCVLTREPLLLLMAPSGVDKGRVRPAELIVVDGQGQVIQGQGRCSAEMPLHAEIVRCTAAGAVLHTHSQAGTLLSRWCLRQSAAAAMAPAGSQAWPAPQEAGGTGRPQASWLVLEGLEMLKGLEGVCSHEATVRVPVLANDQDLIRLSAAARPQLAQAPHGLLIAGHGLYAWGNDLAQAQRHLEVLEFLLEQHWRELLLTASTAPQP